ncbi:MAG: hypothetical protein FVQ81_12780 [Candidatus Glassbacteria bacterium]|nr:hypothetical protein [Candidatus Glassbacteria bacterium]
MDETILVGTRLKMFATDEIDTSDRTWALSWPAERVLSALEGSVRRLGVIRPLYALEGDSGLVVVDGFRRVAAAREAGVEKIPVVLLDKKIEPAVIFETRCADVAGRLTPVESSRLARRLREQFAVAEDDIIGTFLPLWGLGSSKSVLNKLRELERLQEPVARWCAENGVGLREAGRWARMSREGQRAMLVVVRTFKPGGNLLRGYLELTGEITLREHTTAEEVLSESRIRKLLLDPQAAASGGRETVHRVLLERRYPTLRELEEKLGRLTGELGLGGEIRIEPPRLFEGERYRASFEFGSAGELEQAALRLLDAARSGRAGDFFRLLGAPDIAEGDAR